MTSPISRRHCLMAAGLGGLALLTGCNGSPSAGGSDPQQSASGEPTQGEGTTTYPLSLPTPHGTTTLARRPERVAVVAGLQDLDVALSLGVLPVISDSISWPWQTQTVGSRAVEQFDIWSDAGLPFEKILTARPDVILACTYSGLDQDYAKLSRIAPVVALPTMSTTDVWKADWKDIMRLIGTALDRSSAAEAAITATDKLVADTAVQHPHWKGKSLSFVMNRGEQAGLTVTNVAGTSVERVATSLGFAPQPHAAELARTEGDVSLENIRLIDADVLVIAQHGGHGTVDQAKSWLESNKLYQQLSAVRDGRVAMVERDANGELPIAWAFDYPNALSTPWLLQNFGPVVDPATT